MAPLIISSPTAAAAYELVDLLNGHCRAVASPQLDSTWEVRVELSNAPRNILPLSLDGHTHLLRGSAGARVAQQ